VKIVSQKKIVVLAAGLVAVLICMEFLYSLSRRIGNLDKRSGKDGKVFEQISVGENLLRVEVADTAKKISLGLSYREEIGADGMLFVLGRKTVPTFWMKGMKFGLDMIWIDCNSNEIRECVVADVTENVPVFENPEDVSRLPIYSPSKSVTHVLEVPAGWVEKNAVKLETKVLLK